jgi:hypothetical protein
MYKSGTPFDAEGLLDLIDREKDALLQGSAADAETLKDMVPKLFPWVPPSDQGKKMMVRGAKLLHQKLGLSPSVMADLSPERQFFGMFDTGRRSAMLAGVPNGTGREVEVMTTSDGTHPNAFAKMLSTRHWRVGVIDADLEVALISCDARTLVTIAVTAIDSASAQIVGVQFGGAGTGTDLALAADSTLLRAAHAAGATFLPDTDVTGIKLTDRIGAYAHTCMYQVTVRGTKASPIVLQVKLPKSGTADQVRLYNVEIVDSKRADTNNSDISSITEEQQLEALIGDIPVYALTNASLSRADEWLDTLGVYDQWVFDRKSPHGTGKSVREVLEAYASNSLKMSLDFEYAPIWTLEFWLCGRQTQNLGAPITQRDWLRLYQQWYRMLPAVEAAAAATSEFTTEFSNAKIGLVL